MDAPSASDGKGIGEQFRDVGGEILFEVVLVLDKEIWC